MDCLQRTQALRDEIERLKADRLEMAEMILSDDVSEIEISMLEMKAQQIIEESK